ncbi:recombinase family protein [Stenotrophomonas sp. PS02301]|uniref:recombinase family protein n=1 Tax=Stenotrophomonas sp. PS02301 TaxID=2991427 RepID=UPI00249B6573|nr:recombinase family protein [Stenotrophomonas sp. PS02301]
MKIVVYLRVSTARQGRSGLGLEAQRAATDAFVAQRCTQVLQSFTEVESGKDDSRPELAKALHLARVTGATLLIAKLDRLSRNAAFLLALRDSGVKFVAADMPDANELTVGIMALVAHQESEAISKRTREALQAAKARGQRLGNPNGAAALRRAGRGNQAPWRPSGAALTPIPSVSGALWQNWSGTASRPSGPSRLSSMLGRSSRPAEGPGTSRRCGTSWHGWQPDAGLSGTRRRYF